jgi:hydroxymethylpyrimidine pyrophosphatase-like HAD family hydrolase
MLEVSGIGVAMANADDDVKAVADIVTLSNNNDGVAHIIEQMCL